MMFIKYFAAVILLVVVGEIRNVSGQAAANEIPLLASLPNIVYTSTSHQSGYNPEYVSMSDSRGSWCTMRSDNPNDYVQIDLKGLFTVRTIATKGGSTHWTTSYKIEYSTDKSTWQFYQQGGKLKVFTGNTDDTTPVRNSLSPPIRARVFRIYPIAYHSWKVMEVELYAVSCISYPCQNGATCEDDQSGLATCRCRVGYSGKYCEKGSGANVTCSEDFMEIEIDRIAFGDSQKQDFHLKSKSCRATLTGNKLSLRTPLDSCGTTHEQNNHFITYWNEVSTSFKQEDDRNGSAVIRTKNVSNTHFPFFCKYGRKESVNVAYSHVGTYFATEGAFGNFTFTMSLFRNASYLDSYGAREYPVSIGLNEPLYIEYGVMSTSADLVVFAENCRATTTGSPESLPRYDFIKAGCAVDDTMTYDYKLGRVQRFTIKSFRFISSHPVVYLHCELMVCHNATNSRCKQGCLKSPVRVRRDTVDESMLYDLTLNGPMTQKTGGGKSEGKPHGGHDVNKLSPVMVGVGATFGGLFFIVSIILLVVIRRNKAARMRKGQHEVPVNMALAFEQKGVADEEDKM